ncbi:hypothetical protein LCGC14_1872520 [marine sediment metagenome]|uniref:DegT/DnrJ/EryC1/StrS aminotransferase family protein n=1 Tax=marine sediment metagenome TaxID=412755 RepID=A0A0F9J3B1_9ZZZZ
MSEKIIPYHKPIDINFKLKNLHGYLSNFTYVSELEMRIQQLYDVENVIACSSGSIGLLITLQAFRELYDIKTAYTPSFAWFSTKWALEMTNLFFQFRDIEKTTWNFISTEWSDEELILPLHCFGNICEIDASFVIYDGAHALGSKIKEFGLATIMSLAPTKLITACEGGLILTNDDDLAGKVRLLRDKVSRMSELNAIWGLETLKHLDEILEWKRKLYNYYKKHLKGQFQEIPYNSNYATIGFLTDLKTPPEIEFKKYYFPLKLGLTNTNYVYGKIVCLPSWWGVDYEYITNRILEYNEVIK